MDQPLPRWQCPFLMARPRRCVTGMDWTKSDGSKTPVS
ncbi:hypothetical protein SynA1560_02412 [Synechococcus sp. A15-60]|nr:hypothetical protein SynA1560_02412 [Synechococcus sp. A15-60]